MAAASALVLLAGLAAPARAALISGTFSGVADRGSFLKAGGQIDVSGSAVTGSFALASVAGAMSLPGTPPGSYLLPGGAVTYSFYVTALDETFLFGGPTAGGNLSSLGLSDDGTTQVAVLDALFANPFGLTSLALTGPEGSLFGDVGDVGSLHAGSGVALVSPISLAVRFQGSASVAVTSQTVTGQATPEPAGWAVLATGLAALAGAGALRADRRCWREGPWSIWHQRCGPDCGRS